MNDLKELGKLLKEHPVIVVATLAAMAVGGGDCPKTQKVQKSPANERKTGKIVVTTSTLYMKTVLKAGQSHISR